MAAGRRTRNVFFAWWDSVLDAVLGRVPTESRLRTEAERMNEGLSLKANAASFAMARADEARELLAAELENHEALGQQAEQLLRSGDELSAKRCLTLQLASGKEVERLRADYTQRQQEAETSAASFLNEKEDVGRRIEELPALQQDALVMQMQERIQREASVFSLESAKNQFDAVARELRLKKKQAANRMLLESDPNAELDRRITATLGHQKVTAALAALKQKIAARGDVVEAEYELVDDSSVQSARALLDAPRYQGILGLPMRTDTRSMVEARRVVSPTTADQAQE